MRKEVMMNEEYNVRIKPEMGMFLISLRGSLGQDISKGKESFPIALDAFRRGWLEAQVAKDQRGDIYQLHIFCLSELGFRITDSYEVALAERKLPKRIARLLKSVGKWFFGSVERVLLTLLGSDMILRWLVFFFKD